MRETLKDPHRLEHILNAIDRLLVADKNKALDDITEKDLIYFGVVKTP